MDIKVVFSYLLAKSLVMVVVKGASYGDSSNCDEFPEFANYSIGKLQAEAEKYGQCTLYSGGVSNPCNKFYAAGEDNVYIPEGNSLENLNSDILDPDLSAVLKLLKAQCKDAVIHTACYYFYPPCGNSSHFEFPKTVCENICFHVIEKLCPNELLLVLQRITKNCTRFGSALHFPHCCSDAGIKTVDNVHSSTTTEPEKAAVTSAVSVTGALIIVAVLVSVMIVLLVRKSRTKIDSQFTDDEKQTIPESRQLNECSASGSVRYVPAHGSLAANNLDCPTEGRVRHNSTFVRNMSELNLLIPGRHIKLLDTIGQGEFGVVYRGHLTGWQDRSVAELVAVKTLKNMFSGKDIERLMKESEKMKKLNHLHVLSLIGVCLDAGKAPYIIMPYMAKGSLLAYLRKERPHLTVAKEAGENLIADTQRKLLSICLQISQGMCYLAEQKFVHRDLAARNCMISQNFVIKVADFGLSEDVYGRNYFRQTQASEEDKAVKLPIKWMALESLLDGVFTEKTDVWSYGVTCWEVFSLGHTPYPGVDPFSLIKLLRDGGRLEKPLNAACTDKVYELIYQCWMELPDKRNTFSEIAMTLNCLLEDVAGYMDFSAICGVNMASGYDHLDGYLK